MPGTLFDVELPVETATIKLFGLGAGKGKPPCFYEGSIENKESDILQTLGDDKAFCDWCKINRMVDTKNKRLAIVSFKMAVLSEDGSLVSTYSVQNVQVPLRVKKKKGEDNEATSKALTLLAETLASNSSKQHANTMEIVEKVTKEIATSIAAVKGVYEQAGKAIEASTSVTVKAIESFEKITHRESTLRENRDDLLLTDLKARLNDLEGALANPSVSEDKRTGLLAQVDDVLGVADKLTRLRDAFDKPAKELKKDTTPTPALESPPTEKIEEE